MKTLLCCLLLVLLLPVAGQAAVFSDYFEDATMRIDYFHTANDQHEEVSIDQIFIRDTWAGNPNNLVPAHENGKHTVSLVDPVSKRQIYCHHILNIVFEYKGTEEAKAGQKRTFLQTVLMPCPKVPVLFMIEHRDDNNIRRSFFSKMIDPNDINIRREEANQSDLSFTILENGDVHDKVDLVFVAEGYEANESEKFKADTKRFADYLFTVAPFDRLKKQFNVRGVFRASAQSGVDMPRQGIYKNTVLDSSYNTLGMARYCTVFNNKVMHDIADKVPHDFIIVLVNTPRYGGGGFLNDYCLFTSDDKRSKEIFTHEFGHSFAGLADEYISEDLFSRYYKRGVEPLEPNITMHVNPKKIKWGHLLTEDIVIPTPAEEQYDGKVGLFEGAGYTKTGMYRSGLRCVMKDGSKTFCQACQNAIEAVIDHYSN